jgi:S1-C subfamily serine protease
MDLFDVIIVLAAIAYAIGGFRSGAVVGIFSLVGFFAGAVGGAQLADPLGSALADGRAQVPIAIVCVLALAMIGQLLGVWIAGQVKHRIVRDRGRPVDAGLGAVLGVIAVLLVSWMIALPLASSPFPNLAAESGHSKIVRTVDGVMPDPARNLYSSMRSFLDQSGFPPVFGDLPSTSITPVAAPPTDLSPAFARHVTTAQKSIFKIYSKAPECSRGIEGSGFVYAPHRILTNAHVVAGAREVDVQVSANRELTARVVLYDPERDVAVLDVPDLTATPLSFTSTAAGTGDPAVVLGYPEDGPFTVRSARVRGKTTVRGSDIYGDGSITRSIYSIRAVVREGNSGGPLLAQDGTVLGIVFATARDSADTGFVLADDEVASDATQGRTATTAVTTEGCTPD